MSQELLNEREFELVNIVGAEIALNQRELSRRMKLSLGMTNMLVRRLVTKGYIRITQLDSRKVRYILTPKGFAEKMQKSIKYTLKTIDSIGLIKKQLARILRKLYQEGHRKYYVLGESDLAGLIRMVLGEEFNSNMYALVPITGIAEAKKDGIILICTENAVSDLAILSINLIEALANEVGVG